MAGLVKKMLKVFQKHHFLKPLPVQETSVIFYIQMPKFCPQLSLIKMHEIYFVKYFDIYVGIGICMQV